MFPAEVFVELALNSDADGMCPPKLSEGLGPLPKHDCKLQVPYAHCHMIAQDPPASL